MKALTDGEITALFSLWLQGKRMFRRDSMKAGLTSPALAARYHIGRQTLVRYVKEEARRQGVHTPRSMQCWCNSEHRP